MTITNQREPSFRDQISEKSQLENLSSETGQCSQQRDGEVAASQVAAAKLDNQQRDCEVAESQVEVIIESMQLVLNRVFGSRC